MIKEKWESFSSSIFGVLSLAIDYENIKILTIPLIPCLSISPLYHKSNPLLFVNITTIIGFYLLTLYSQYLVYSHLNYSSFFPNESATLYKP